MGKLSAGFDLATELRALRKASRLTQAALAAKAALAERTVRALEQGSGTLDSWHAALAALGHRRASYRATTGTGRGIAALRRGQLKIILGDIEMFEVITADPIEQHTGRVWILPER